MLNKTRYYYEIEAFETDNRIKPEPRLWEGKLIVRGITAAKYLFCHKFGNERETVQIFKALA